MCFRNRFCRSYSLGKASAFCCIQRQKDGPDLLCHRLECCLGLGVAHDDLRCRVVDEIGDLVRGKGGVERQKNYAGLKAGKVERQRLRRFWALHRQPVALDHSAIAQAPCCPIGARGHIGIGDGATLSQMQQNGVTVLPSPISPSYKGLVMALSWKFSLRHGGSRSWPCHLLVCEPRGSRRSWSYSLRA